MLKKLSVILTLTLLISSFLVPRCFAEGTYQCTKLELGDFSYDPTEGVLSAYAQLIGYESSVCQETAPTSGTVILAAYKRGELVAVNMSHYTGLTADMPHEVKLRLDYVDNISVKAYLVDSIDNLIPLTISKECTDVDKLIVYDDILTDEDTIIKTLHTFEEDKMAYNEYVASYTLQKIATNNINTIEVASDANGNSYLSMKTPAGSTHPYVVLDCGNLQKLVAQFDIQCSEYARSNIYAYDSNGSDRVAILQIAADGTMSSNETTVGKLNETGWTRIKIAIDNIAKQISFYVGDCAQAATADMAGTQLTDIRAMRIYAMSSNSYDTELMLDNMVVYSGNSLYDFSKILAGEIDEDVHVYNHNITGLNEFFKDFSAIHTATARLCDGSVSECSQSPEYREGVLYVTKTDAAKLCGTSDSSLEMVALEAYAQANGKKVTYTKTSTVLVGDKNAVLSDEMIKLVNSHLTYDRPSKDDLLAAMEDKDISRPCLSLTPEKLSRIKKLYSDATDAYITKWCTQIISDADSLLNRSVLEFVEYDGDQSDRLHVVAKNVKERVQKLALAYHLTNDSRYAERAWEEIENACSFPHWHQGINELDSANMAAAIAYGYDWLYDYWANSGAARYKIMENAIFENQLNWAQECYHGIRPYGCMVTENNWNATCNGYTAFAACAVYEADPEKCADIIANAIGCSESTLKEFYPNGAWKEGTGYWNGTVEPYAEMFSTIKTLFGSSYNLECTEAFDITANYMLASSGPTGNNNYNDSNSVTYYTQPTMFWFSEQYGNTGYGASRLSQLDGGAAELGVLDLCWYNPDTEYIASDLALDAYFERLELASLRSSWNDPDATYVSFHSGNNLNSAGHSHIDSGTFVLDMLGERFAVDLGSHYYYTTGHGQAPDTQPDDDGSTITRWDYYHHVPEGHNCFVINPDRTLGQNIVTDDKMESFASGTEKAFAITSLTSAYEGYAQYARRGIMLSDNRKCVTVRDEIDLNSGDNEIYWYMHKSEDCAIEKIDDTSFYLTLNGKRIKVILATNADNISVYEAPAVHLVREAPPQQEEVTDINKLVIKMDASGSVYLQVKFIPLDGTTADIIAEDIILDNWSVD